MQKLLATANMHLQEHIQKQVSVQTIGHLRGITEYGLHWLHSAVTFADRIADVSEAFRELSDGLGICAENYKVPKCDVREKQVFRFREVTRHSTIAC